MRNVNYIETVNKQFKAEPSNVEIATYQPNANKKTILDVLNDVRKNGFESLSNSANKTIDGMSAVKYLSNLQKEADKLPKGMLNRQFNVSTVLVNKQTHKPLAYMFNICVSSYEPDQVNDLALDVFSKFTKAVHDLDILPGNSSLKVNASTNLYHIMYHGQALTFVWLDKKYLKR